ncbi:MAG: prepilin-type N-terminal cleavage/methylation domain-containing protein [Syntrophothermus sp.]|uniref:prepilin-type N-terminal cleavage/methylation domain-containing protein n=1 Tax=Syntrophothermus sp. TaxID=2736299 RepID=UPI00257C660C|nr:prepilin-type N-terminal cleavage/methylation domain-containing protein [Syntrophothermus sp.]NSW81710.1 prepilin-type N-terminal cleavage/methylation domain-containing protein [Syntrophothermus sp.]
MKREKTDAGEKYQRKHRRVRLKPNGFTLIELVAVVAVLALLASLAAPQVVKALNLSKEKACMANVKLIEDAANLYAANEPNPVTLTGDNIITTLQGAKYLQRGEFKCPVDGKSYTLSGDATNGYTVTCPNNCDGK